jgi:hypothetical protein
MQAAGNVESGMTEADRGQFRELALLRNKGRCLKNRAPEGFLQLQTATAARHEDGIGLAAECLAIFLDKGKRFCALSGMCMHRTAACLIRRDADAESLACQQRNERLQCRRIGMSTDATRKQLNMPAWFGKRRIEPRFETEGPVLRNQCEQLREDDPVRLRQKPADTPPHRKRHVEQPVAGQQVKQASMPPRSQFCACLVKDGAILDVGGTGPFAATAQETIIEMTKKPVVSLELAAGNTLYQGDSPSW